MNDNVSRVVTHGVERFVDRNNLFHSVNDRPAVSYPDGTRMHYDHGTLHREGDKPAVYNDAKNDAQFYLRGVLHREGDKPAVVQNTTTEKLDRNVDRANPMGMPQTVYVTTTKYMWYKNGKLDRENRRPAIMVWDGETLEARYFEDGRELTGLSQIVRGQEAREFFDRYINPHPKVSREDQLDSEPTLEPTTDAPAEPTTAEPTESTSEPATESTSEPATESTSEPATESTSEPATDAPVELTPEQELLEIVNSASTYSDIDEKTKFTPFMSKRLVRAREDQERPFHTVSELSKVKGVGEKTVAKAVADLKKDSES